MTNFSVEIYIKKLNSFDFNEKLIFSANFYLINLEINHVFLKKKKAKKKLQKSEIKFQVLKFYYFPSICLYNLHV